ncbi:MAG TPA: histidine kinase [Pseudonocardiaceae bacterium]|nr:histidine kinase [Pseudonocardiaceae bacterium]
MNPSADADRTPLRRPATVVAPVEDARTIPDSGRPPVTAWILTRLTLTVVFCASCLIALLEVWEADHSVVGTAVATLLMAALLAIQLFQFSRPGADLHSPRSYALLALLAALAYVPLLFYGFSWISLPPFVAGCLLLVLPPVAAWSSFAVVTASVLVIRITLAEDPVTLVYGALDAAFFGLVVYLLTRLASLVAELHAAREEMAQLAVAQERLRFARDLHDLLGLSLSAITLKCELANRLLVRYPARAKQELTEILDLARRALADVRSAAGGYRELSLDHEVVSAESVLHASDVEVRVHTDYAELPEHVRTLLGTVLREGVTNVLRHSKAEHCEIAIRQTATAASVEIVNDGVGPAPVNREPDSGNGIRNLTDRVTALSGQLTTAVLPNGRFRLVAQVPLPHAPRRSMLSSRRVHPARGVEGKRTTTLPMSARTTLALVNIAFTIMFVGTVAHLLMVTRDFWTLATGIGYLVVLLTLQLAYFSRSTTRLRSPLGYSLLLVQAGLIFLPILQQGDNWVSLPGWLGGNALLMLPAAGGFLVFAASVGSVAWSHVLSSGQPLDIIFNTNSTVITGAIAYGLTALTKLIAELAATRKQLATMAVADERLRFARDLHDLLGLSLSAITLKTELTNRLLDRHPDQAADELGEILALARQALTDVRSVASGYRELSFDKESQSAESVLTAADVNVRMDLVYDELPVRVRTVLAVVLREGVTNVLRHSRARHCDIVLRQLSDEVSLSIVNDGLTAGELAAPEPDDGSGIRNLSERVAKLGGELDCGEDARGTFRLLVRLPLARAAQQVSA